MNGKVVLSFILGAAGGAVGMYFGMKQACEAYIANEIEKFKADYEAAHKSKCEEKSEDLKDIDGNLKKDAEKALKKYASATEKSISSVDSGKKEADLKAEKINYAKIRTPVFY